MNNKLIILILMIFVVGFGVRCNSDEQTTKIDEETFFKNFDSAPSVIVSKEELPEWLILKIDFFETGAGTGIQQQLKIFRGIWNGRVIFFLEYLNNCIMCDIYYESGERLVWSEDGHDYDKFRSESKGWTLVYQIEPVYSLTKKVES